MNPMQGGGFPPPTALGVSGGNAAHGHAAPHASGQPPQRAAGGAQSGDGAGLFNIIGAAVSVALVVGLGLWGYKLALRDVSGVPVVRALEGPMRIQPADPGGAVAPHQGLAVNGVAAAGISAEPVEAVLLSPPVMALTEDDVPAVPATAPAAEPLPAQVDVTSSSHRPATALPMPASGGEIDADAAVAAALDFSGLSDDSADTPIVVIPKSVPGVNRSPRPMRRPAHLSAIASPVQATNVSAPMAAPITASTAPPVRPDRLSVQRPELMMGREVAPEAVAPGSWMAQLHAHKSADDARAHWQRLARVNPVLFHQRDWTIEQGASGGAPFFRLRAIGFVNGDDARGFCKALINASGSCVPLEKK